MTTSKHSAGGERLPLLGVGINMIDMAEAVSAVDGLAEAGGSHYVCLCNAYGLMIAQDDEAFRSATNEADLVLPDGMPLVWAARLLKCDQKERIYGPDLMWAVCKAGVPKGYSHYFYGGEPGIPERVAQALQAAFPGLRVAGCCSPPFRPLSDEEECEIATRINDSNATILWVGLGAPKQERWMAAHRGLIHVPVMFGVGAAFDFISGRVRQAPRLFMNLGLEWLFRLAVEPRRLWRRYIYHNPRFVFRISKEIIKRRLKG